MKRFLMLIALSFVLSSLFSVSTVSTYYKANKLPDGTTTTTNSQDVAKVPVTLDLTQVNQAHVDMGFFSDKAHTTNLSTIALKDNDKNGRIDAFNGAVYAYCTVVSTRPVVISIMGKGPLTTEQSTNNTFNWQVYYKEGENKKVFFKGLEGEYGSVKDAPLLTHDPVNNKGNIKSFELVELFVESEDYRGKVVGDYRSCLYMVITSIG